MLKSVNDLGRGSKGRRRDGIVVTNFVWQGIIGHPTDCVVMVMIIIEDAKCASANKGMW